VIVGVSLTASDPHRTTSQIAVAGALIAHALFRSLVPIRWTTTLRGAAEVVLEIAGCCAAVVATGYWSSPFVFTMATGVVAAGVAGGFAVTLPLAVVAGAVVTVAAGVSTGGTRQDSTDGVVELLLAGLVAGYARRLFSEAEREARHTLGRLDALTEANGLLQQLNAVA
jgi:hypothetical protein